MPLITNEWQVLFLVWILFQWEPDESIRLHVLFLLLYWELLHVLLDVASDHQMKCQFGLSRAVHKLLSPTEGKKGSSHDGLNIYYLATHFPFSKSFSTEKANGQRKGSRLSRALAKLDSHSKALRVSEAL
ncbi:hypothetical protein F8388_002426 [Cannabis sativa]|uniref:Uncharacterized protein n=1 Tax=Cannabis sativa TaxID=3483 RepID=A0A7J6DQ21_CANSA|nr:hypothetical protein F8388_002426 [Cannabis sativa]